MSPKSPEDDPKNSSDDSFARRIRRDRHLTWASRIFMLIGLLIAVQHLVAHAGFRPVPAGMGLQDLVIGYPTAILVFFAGLIIWGRSPTPS